MDIRDSAQFLHGLEKGRLQVPRANHDGVGCHGLEREREGGGGREGMISWYLVLFFLAVRYLGEHIVASEQGFLGHYI